MSKRTENPFRADWKHHCKGMSVKKHLTSSDALPSHRVGWGWDSGVYPSYHREQAGYTLDRSRTNEPNLNNCMSLDLGGSCGVPGENWSKHMIIYLLLANIFSLFLIKSTEYTFQWYFQKQSKLDDLFSSLRMIQNERLQFSI